MVIPIYPAQTLFARGGGIMMVILVSVNPSFLDRMVRKLDAATSFRKLPGPPKGDIANRYLKLTNGKDCVIAKNKIQQSLLEAY